MAYQDEGRRVGVPCNRIAHGDCIQRLKALADGTVDLVLTDPPYMRPRPTSSAFPRPKSIMNPSTGIGRSCMN